MHRQVALRKATVERRAEMATYVSECALLLARVTSNLCLSDEPEKTHPLHFSIADESKREPRACPSGHAPKYEFLPRDYSRPLPWCLIGSTRNRMPAYVLKCDGLHP